MIYPTPPHRDGVFAKIGGELELGLTGGRFFRKEGRVGVNGKR